MIAEQLAAESNTLLQFAQRKQKAPLKNGENLSGRGQRSKGGESDDRPVQHGGADEEHDSPAAEGKDTTEASRGRRRDCCEADLHRQGAGRRLRASVKLWSPAHVPHHDGVEGSWRIVCLIESSSSCCCSYCL